MAQVEQAFQQVFGPYAGWAHNTLFISELASMRHRLPARLVEPAKRKASQPKAETPGSDSDQPEAAELCGAQAPEGNIAPRNRRRGKAGRPSREGSAALGSSAGAGRSEAAGQVQAEAAALRADGDAGEPASLKQVGVSQGPRIGAARAEDADQAEDCDDCQVWVDGCQLVDPKEMGLPPGLSYPVMTVGASPLRRYTVKVAQPGEVARLRRQSRQ